MQIKFERSAIRKGLRVFFGLSIASIAVVFIFTSSKETLSALKRVEPLYLLLAVLVMNGDWFGAGLRLFILSRRRTKKIGYVACLKAALANTFMGAVTPSQTGGGPAQIYVLYKEGMPVVEAMSISLMTFLTTVVFLVLSTGTIILLNLDSSLSNQTLRFLFRYGVSLFLIIGVLVIVFIAKPDLLRRVMTLFFNFLSKFRKKHFLRPGGKANEIIDAVDRCHKIMVFYFTRAWPAMIVAVLITGAIFFVKFFTAFLIVKGLGVEASVWEVISIQILITLATYFCPTPGATGAAELGSAVLMASIVPVELIMLYVVLWRAIVAYTAVILGAGVVMRSMGKEAVSLEAGELNVPEKEIALTEKGA